MPGRQYPANLDERTVIPVEAVEDQAVYKEIKPLIRKF